MQRVSALLSWDRRKSQPTVKPPAPKPKPLNLGPNTNGKFESQQFWPASLDQECDKAARILKSFCTDGYLVPLDEKPAVIKNDDNTENSPRKTKEVTKRIPKRVIQDAAGIAVFTCMRSGLWMTGSGGSGILIARKADGTWSPPSALILHTPTLSFIIGIDVYDCVLIITSHAALESLTRSTTTLGEDVGLLNGPLTLLDSDDIDTRPHELDNTVFTYLKSRSKAQTVNLNGCILSERSNENYKFYEREVTVEDVLAGRVSKYCDNAGPLFEVIKLAEGRIDYDAELIEKISTHPAPGDALIETPKAATAPLEVPPTPRLAFGIPHPEDPDPYGLKALEMAGMEIREAGSRSCRPPSSQFDGTSMKHYSRSSTDMFSPRSNRGSLMSTRTGTTFMTDMGAQSLATPATIPSPVYEEKRHSMERKPSEVDYTKIDFSAIRHLSGTHTLDSIPITESIAATTESDRQSSTTISSQPSTPPLDIADDKNLEIEPCSLNNVKEEKSEEVEKTEVVSSSASVKLVEPSSASVKEPKVSDADNHANGKAEDEEDEDTKSDFETSDDEFIDFDDEEEPVVFEVSSVQPVVAPQAAQVVKAKGTVVNIAKRVPPLPIRSPARLSRASKSEVGDVTFLKTPLRQSFTNDSQSVHSVHSSGASIVSIGSPRVLSPRLSPRLSVQPPSLGIRGGHGRSRSLVVKHAEEIVSSPLTPTCEDQTPTATENQGLYTVSPEHDTPKAFAPRGRPSVSEEENSDAASFKSSDIQNVETVAV